MYTFAEKQAMEACKIDTFNQINLPGIKANIEKMLGMIGQNGIFDEYTKHTIGHVNKMLELLDMLIPDETKTIMTSADWLLVVLSIYFHDLGMLVTKNEYNNRAANDRFQEYKSAYLENKNNTASISLLDDNSQERFVFQEFVRTNHGKRISDWIKGDNIRIYDKAVIDLISDMTKGLPALFINDLANVCASHNENDINDNHKYPVKRPYGISLNESANVFYTVLLLRTADLLHITSDRTPTVELKLISPTNPRSQIEWAKQSSVSGISPLDKLNEDGNVDPGIQTDTISITGYFNNPDGYFALMDYLAYARKEIKISHKLNEESKRRYASRYDFPWKAIDDSGVGTKNFEPRQLSFSIDQQKTLDLLVGETLYNNITVSLRELAQNAIDAVKVRRYEENGTTGYIPKVDVFWDSNTRYLTVCDNGTGMNMDIIENYLLKVGSSRYKDEDFVKSHPDFNSISRFGIGLLTCFLVADNVDVLTKMKSEENPLLLKINKLHGRYLLRHDIEEETDLRLMGNIGTSIRLQIRPEIDFNPEYILKDWILIPNCEFLFHQGEDSMSIGYDNTKDYLINVLNKNGINVDGIHYKIENINENGVDFSVLLKKSKYYNEWNFVDYVDVLGYQDLVEVPCGLAVEGIRINEDSPGFKMTYLLAMVNLSGDNAPKTNVARSSLDSLSIDSALKTIYETYLSIINLQKEQLSKDQSITWASTELTYYLNRFVNKNHTSGDILLNNKIFHKILEQYNCFLIETDTGRSFCSLSDLKKKKHFWTIESAAYNSANVLLREINTRSDSAVSLLKSLYGTEHPMLKDVDCVLCNQRFRNSLDTSLLEEFYPAQILICEKERSILMLWQGIDDSECRWKKIRIPNRSQRSDKEGLFLFVQTGEDPPFNTQYNGVRGEYGMFLFSGSNLHDYIDKLYSQFNAGNEKQKRVLSAIVAFIYDHPSYNYGARDNIKNDVSTYFSQRYSPEFYKEITSFVEIDEFVDVLSRSSHVVYDKTWWFREGSVVI